MKNLINMYKKTKPKNKKRINVVLKPLNQLKNYKKNKKWLKMDIMATFYLKNKVND
jgi:hypothetical protein